MEAIILRYRTCHRCISRQEEYLLPHQLALEVHPPKHGIVDQISLSFRIIRRKSVLILEHWWNILSLLLTKTSHQSLSRRACFLSGVVVPNHPGTIDLQQSRMTSSKPSNRRSLAHRKRINIRAKPSIPTNIPGRHHPRAAGTQKGILVPKATPETLCKKLYRSRFCPKSSTRIYRRAWNIGSQLWVQKLKGWIELQVCTITLNLSKEIRRPTQNHNIVQQPKETSQTIKIQNLGRIWSQTLPWLIILYLKNRHHRRRSAQIPRLSTKTRLHHLQFWIR